MNRLLKPFKALDEEVERLFADYAHRKEATEGVTKYDLARSAFMYAGMPGFLVSVPGIIIQDPLMMISGPIGYSVSRMERTVTSLFEMRETAEDTSQVRNAYAEGVRNRDRQMRRLWAGLALSDVVYGVHMFCEGMSSGDSSVFLDSGSTVLFGAFFTLSAAGMYFRGVDPSHRERVSLKDKMLNPIRSRIQSLKPIPEPSPAYAHVYRAD